MGAIRTTIQYARRNGVSAAWTAARERLYERRHGKYDYLPPDEAELSAQRGKRYGRPLLFSIVVPAYETPEVYLQDMILSVTEQTYADYELIIADASKSDAVRAVVSDFCQQYERIVYLRLPENGGISANTNAALEQAQGDYVVLLDHDDLLTEDALYRLREEIDKATESDGPPALVYSDEDKCDAYIEKYYEVNRKHDFDPEMLLTNNYICHLSAYRRDVICRLRLRPAYDGAQDHDLALRCVDYVLEQSGHGLTSIAAGGGAGVTAECRRCIRHVPRVLYHWRTHGQSTAGNPGAKEYAYDAGRRSIEDALRRRGIVAAVRETAHHGFYHIDYEGGVMAQRPDIGVVGGPVHAKGRVVSGAMDAQGEPLYGGLREGWSGEMHRASIQQLSAAVDIRSMEVCEALRPLYRECTGRSYPYEPQAGDTEEKLRSASLRFCKKAQEQGYAVLYDPELGGADGQ